MASTLELHYGLVVDNCELQFAWWFDEYSVKTPDRTLTLRVARGAEPGYGELQEAALRACSSSGVDVAMPLETLDGRLFCRIPYPEGARDGILTLPVDALGTLDDFGALGHVAAQLHAATDGVVVEDAKAWTPASLVGSSPEWLERIYRDAPDDGRAMADWRAQALAVVASEADVQLQFCHGELYPAAFESRARGRLGVAALSYCGVGHRLYDIATVRWVLELHARERADALFDEFLTSYGSVRPLDIDEVELRAWVALRHLWSLRLGWELSSEQGVASLVGSGLHRRAAFTTHWVLDA